MLVYTSADNDFNSSRTIPNSTMPTESNLELIPTQLCNETLRCECRDALLGRGPGFESRDPSVDDDFDDAETQYVESARRCWTLDSLERFWRHLELRDEELQQNAWGNMSTSQFISSIEACERFINSGSITHVDYSRLHADFPQLDEEILNRLHRVSGEQGILGSQSSASNPLPPGTPNLA